MDYASKLDRFIEAQNSPGHSGYNHAVEEIKKGMKLSHWIWYVFPQLKSISQNNSYEMKYGIESIEEANAYLNNQTLRMRLENVCEILLKHEGLTASGIFGVTDASKVRSSMTLFYLASRNELYRQVLDKYYNGRPCQKTLYALKMNMPSRGDDVSVKQIDDSIQEKGKKYAKDVLVYNTISRKRNTQQRKIKKILILFICIIGIVGVFGGVGYGVYHLISNSQHNDDNIVIRPVNPNIDLHVNVTILTSDNKYITSSDRDKYSMSITGSLGKESVRMDSVTRSFHFLYNNENIAEKIKVSVLVENCSIGVWSYDFSYFKREEGSIDENIKLGVSSEDLRIYEELLWYKSSKKKIATTKYPKYEKRIKNVQNKKFSIFLTQKLESIGHETIEKKQKDDIKQITHTGELPDKIKQRIRSAISVPMSLTSDLTPNERRVIVKYNEWIHRIGDIERDRPRHHEFLHRLRMCTSFKELEYIIMRYRHEF